MCNLINKLDKVNIKWGKTDDGFYKNLAMFKHIFVASALKSSIAKVRHFTGVKVQEVCRLYINN